MKNSNFEDFLGTIARLKAEGRAFVIVTLVKQVGSSPQDVGARALVSTEGLEFGTVGGGKVENRAILEAQNMISSRTPHCFVDWNLQKDIGMTCGGVVSFFFEFIEPEHPFHVAVFGAGHIAQEFVRLLLHLDCQITCLDSRLEWLQKLPTSPKLSTICTEDLAGSVHHLPDRSFVAIMTMGHGTDLPVLIETMKQRSRFSYVGNIGSAQKSLRLKNDLLAAGISKETIEQFYCPMGEDFGNNSPVEIAFSIVAQILKTKDQVFGEQNKETHGISTRK